MGRNGELQWHGIVMLLLLRFVAMLRGTRHTARRLGEYHRTATSAIAGEAGTPADVDPANAVNLSAAAAALAGVAAPLRLPRFRADDRVEPIPSRTASAAFAAPARLSEERHRTRLYPVLFLKGTLQSSADVLQTFLLLLLLFSSLGATLPCSRFQHPPFSAITTAGQHAAAATGKAVQATAPAASGRATPDTPQGGETATVLLRRAECAGAAALHKLPAAVILQGSTQARPERADLRLRVFPAPALSKLAAIATPAAGPGPPKGRISGERLNRCCATVASPLRLCRLQQAPSFFAALQRSASPPFSSQTPPRPPHRSGCQSAQQKQCLLTVRAAAAAAGAAVSSFPAAALPRGAALNHDSPGCLLLLTAARAHSSRLQQHSVHPPADEKPQHNMRIRTNGWWRSAVLSLISSEQPRAILPETVYSRQSSPFLHTACAKECLAASPSDKRQHELSLVLPSVYSRLRCPFDSSSCSPRTSLLHSVCLIPSLPTRAPKTVFGRHNGRRVCSRRTPALVTTIQRSQRVCMFPWIRLGAFFLSWGAPNFPAATCGPLRSTARLVRTVCTAVSATDPLAPFRRSHTTDRMSPLTVAVEGRPDFPAQTSPSKASQNASLPPPCTCTVPLFSSALLATSAVPLAFLRVSVLRGRPTNHLVGRGHSVAALRASCYTQRLAPYAASVALGKEIGTGATQCTMPLLQRQQQAPSHLVRAGLTQSGRRACPSQGHILRQQLYHDTSNSSSNNSDRRRIDTSQKWLSYVGITSRSNGGSDGSCRQTLWALPPRRRGKAVHGSGKRGGKELSTAETADSHCVLRRPTWMQRAAAAGIYVVPYLELFHMFLPFLASLLPSMAPAWERLARILELYARIPCSNLLTFVAPYTFIIKKQSFFKPSYFLQHHTMTALLVSMLQYTISMIYFKGFRGSFADGSSTLHETIVLSLFLSIYTVLFNAVCHALAGEYAWIPVVTEAVNMHIGDRPSPMRESIKDRFAKPGEEDVM